MRYTEHMVSEPASVPASVPARERILNAATVLFHRQGISATAVDQILAESGTGKGQFYHYFDGKRAVVNAVADRHAAEKIEQLQTHLQREPGIAGVEGWLAEVLDQSVNDGLVGGCPMASMAAEVGETDPVLREKLAMAFDGQLALLADALRVERESGQLMESADPDVVAMRVLTSLQGGLLLAATMKEPALLEEAVAAGMRELGAVRIERT